MIYAIVPREQVTYCHMMWSLYVDLPVNYVDYEGMHDETDRERFRARRHGGVGGPSV